MKKRFNALARVIKTGAMNFVRNVWLAIAAMAVMIVTLTIILFMLVASNTFNHTISKITSKIDISVYLNKDVKKPQRQKLARQLRALPTVKSVSYVSKNSALKAYKHQNAGNSQLLQAIAQTGNPLPASLEIKPDDPSHIQPIKDFLEKPDNKKLQDPQAGTSYSGDRKAAIDNIAHATDVIRHIGVVAVIIFAVISMLIIFNTIQMAIFNRREELQIMRLLGATTWYIRGPFVVESIIYGVLSAIISVLLIDGVFVASAGALQASSLGLLDISYAGEFFHSNFWQFLTLQIAIGILIGAVSSVIATRKYLKFHSH
jgi:cell division transport system permease protein